jgi:hypothetical protein
MLTAPTPFITDKNDFTPLNDIQPVTPNDGADLPGGTCRALILTGAGNLCFVTAAGTTVTLAISSAWFGVQYIRASRIKATGTTIAGGNIFACY